MINTGNQCNSQKYSEEFSYYQYTLVMVKFLNPPSFSFSLMNEGSIASGPKVLTVYGMCLSVWRKEGKQMNN